MGKLLKFMKRYKWHTLLVVLLLIVQAYCDLSLPNYTADVVDTGVMQNGIDNIAPNVIGKDKFEEIMLFMNDDEQKAVKEHYVLKDNISESDMPVESKHYDGEIYVRDTDDKKIVEDLNDKMAMPISVYNMMNQMGKDSSKTAEMSEENKKQAEELGKLIKENIAENQKKMAEQNGGNSPAGMQAQMEGSQADMQAQAQGGQQADMDMFSLMKSGLLDGKIIRNYFDKSFGDNKELITSQYAKAFVSSEYERLGVDINKVQNSYLKVAAGKMIGMAAIMMICSILICYLSAVVGSGIGLDLRVGIFKKVMKFSNAEMENFSTSSLVTRCTNDVQQIQMVLTMMLRMCLYAPVLGIGGIIKVYNTNVSMMWTIGLAVGLVFAVVMVLMSLAMPKFKVMQTKVDNLNRVAREILTGLSVIRAFSREKHEEERFDGVNKDLTKTMLFTNRVMTFMMPAMTLIMNGTSVLIVWVSAKQIDLGKLQVGTMTAFITYSMLIIMSFLMLTMISVMLPRAIVAAERIDEILISDISVRDLETADDNLQITKGDVCFDHVNFRYKDADCDVLEDIDFTAKSGETTAIVGSTGSGKSTLVNLIVRAFDVTEGKITIDGRDIRDYKQHNLREKIGFVPQKAILFSGDIKSNIAYGCDNADISHIEKSAEIAQAKDFIEAKPDKYDSPIAQGGSNVSGGQKQRLSIARAIAKDAKVYVFDDSFSALDFKTDVALRKSLNENVKDAAVIIVAQRVVTVMNADKIIVLDEGRIAGQGTHYELLRNCEVYEQIVKSQLSEKEYEEQMAIANKKGVD